MDNKYNARMFNFKKDFKVIEHWIKAVDQIPVSEDVLPSVGGIIEKNEKQICCGFLYLSNDTPVSLIEWVYFNPDADGIDKYVCAYMLYEMLCECSVAEKHPVIFASTSSNGLSKVIEANGFINNANGMKHYYKVCKTGEEK